MLRRQNDLAERQYLYDHMTTSIQAAQDTGVFTDVDANVTRLMTDISPASIGRRNELLFTDDYSPNHRPLVFAMHHGEEKSINIGRAAARSLRSIVANNGLSTLLIDTVDSKVPDGAMISETGLLSKTVSWNQAGKPLTNLQIPITIALAPEIIYSSLFMPVLAHDMSQWNFHMHADLYDEDMALPNAVVSAMRERQAHVAAYTVERNLGYHNGMPTPAELADQYSPTDDPAAVGEQIQYKAIEHWSRTENPHPIGQSLAALAISHLLADPVSGSLTTNETAAYRSAGFI